MNSEEISQACSPPATRDSSNRYDLDQKIQALTLYSVGFKADAIERQTGVSRRGFYRILAKAKERGYDPTVGGRVLEAYCEDGKRTGRPKKIEEDIEKRLLDAVRKDRSGRESSSEVLAYLCDISHASALRILRKYGLTNVKPTTKPGLTAAQKKARYEFCLAHAEWTLEDWKNVIWSDETSVILGVRRGTVRVWRSIHEQFDSTVVRRRWKSFSSFMFWACFSYDKRGPCHIFKAETAAMRKAAEVQIAAWNVELEKVAREAWELEVGVARLGLRNRPGRKPRWSFNKRTGKLVRESNGGIDWYRYQTEVMIPLLLPFAEECHKERPGTIVQEDNAPAHAHRIQDRVYSLFNVLRLLWPPNSPDLNAIEKAWAYLKRVTTAQGAAKTVGELEARWRKAWAAIPQHQIQAWIEGIYHNIQEVLRLEGGNEYPEGRQTKRSWAGKRLKGQLSSHTYINAAKELWKEL